MPQALLFDGAGEPLRRAAQSTLPPEGGALRVRILCCTLCQSDLATYSGRRLEPVPAVLGHEVVGAIESFGPSASRIDAAGRAADDGSRVTWAIVAHCGECFFCTRDLPQKCIHSVKYGHHVTTAAQPDGGGLADTITLVSGTAWFRIPDRLSTRVASLANCAAATAEAVLEAAGSFAGQVVLVFGAGVLGILACAMAAARRADRIVAADPDRGCRDRAILFGATHILDPMNEDFQQQLRMIARPHGADAALELAGRTESVVQCLASVRTGGVVVLAGTISLAEAVPLDPQVLVRQMLTLRGVHNQPRHLQAALDFLANATVPLDSLIAAIYPLNCAKAAFAAALESRGRRIAVTPEQAK